MDWMYYDNRLMVCSDKDWNETTCRDFIDVSVFEHLTGKKINWDKREFKKVTTARVKGHVKAYDSEFIVGEKYKKNGKIYKCSYVDKKGIAMLTPQGNILKVVASKDTYEWEIA